MLSPNGDFLLEMVNIFPQSFHKGSHMVTVADCVVNLNGQRQEPFAVSLEELAHGENRQQEFPREVVFSSIAYVFSFLQSSIKITTRLLSMFHDILQLQSLHESEDRLWINDSMLLPLENC